MTDVPEGSSPWEEISHTSVEKRLHDSCRGSAFSIGLVGREESLRYLGYRRPTRSCHSDVHDSVLWSQRVAVLTGLKYAYVVNKGLVFRRG